MTKRTPAAERVISAAIHHFALRGYDAGSLSEIASSIGIRKPSLYAHFASKVELFRAAYSDSIELEKSIAAQCFVEETPDSILGSTYLRSIIRRYPESPHLRLFLRTSYMPPSELEKWIDSLHEQYLDQLRDAFVLKLTQATSLEESRIHTSTLCYLGIVDSVQVKLIYTTPELAEIRLTAMQELLDAALKRS